MLDPQAIQLVIFLMAAVFCVAVIVGCFYGVYLLAKIRTQSMRIARQLEEVLSKMASGDPSSSKVS